MYFFSINITFKYFNKVVRITRGKVGE